MEERWADLEELAGDFDFEVVEENGDFTLMGHSIAITYRKTLEGIEQAIKWLTAYGDENYW